MRSFIALVLLLITISGVSAAETAQAVAVLTDARASTPTETRVLRAGSDLKVGETVITDALGQVQIVFSDTTELVVGPNSKLVLEDYLLRADGSVGKLAIDALAGTFRFATGNSEKNAYSINTPAGTLGVRGTAFDFFIINGVTYLIVYHGTALMCGANSSCVEVTESCQVGTIDAGSARVIGLSTDASDEEREGLRSGFRYADNQAPLESSFRVEQVPTCQLVSPQKIMPASLQQVLDVCSPVVAEQYAGETGRWGECGAAVAGFVGGLPPEARSETIANLVAELVELFRDGEACSRVSTELPDAIVVAALEDPDAAQQLQVREIAETLRDCQTVRTAALERVVSPAN